VLLRGLGRTDVFPDDDVGAGNNLVRWLKLGGPLNYGSVQQVLAKWHPYSGVIYFGLLADPQTLLSDPTLLAQYSEANRYSSCRFWLSYLPS
jgi:3-methyladenine DNA glycosylase/8-oxoguanine DNA glycosylase